MYFIVRKIYLQNDDIIFLARKKYLFTNIKNWKIGNEDAMKKWLVSFKLCCNSCYGDIFSHGDGCYASVGSYEDGSYGEELWW